MSTASESSESIGSRSAPRLLGGVPRDCGLARLGRSARHRLGILRSAGQKIGQPAGAPAAGSRLRRAERRGLPTPGRGDRCGHAGDVGARARRLGPRAAVGGRGLLARRRKAAGRRLHRLDAPLRRLDRVESATMAGDDAVELGQRLDLVDDDTAHLGGAVGGLLRQFEDAPAQLVAGRLELLLHLGGHPLQALEHLGEAPAACVNIVLERSVT